MNTYLSNRNNSRDLNHLAGLFLNHTALSVNNKLYRICEIEFYLLSKDHEDRYTHCNPDQAMYGTFYFHKYKNGSYKGGTYKCFDITLGSGDFFGVLIISIYDIEESRMICGPCLSVNEILSAANEASIKCLVETMGTIDILNNNIMSLVDYDHEKEQIYSGPRIGLSDKFPKWKDVRYRFAIHQKLMKRLKTALSPV